MATNNQDYKNINYDRLAIWVKKGTRDEYKQSAAEMGISLAVLIQNGVEEYISNHAGEKPPFVLTTLKNKLSTEDKRLLDSAGKLTPDARKQLVKFLEILTARAATISDTKGGD